MEQLEVFLGQLNSNYPLNIVSPALCISLANSGRRGNAKEFHITLESFVSSLNDIRENIEAFPATYDESAWRSGSDSFFTDNHAKSLCGVQTRPYFETVNKFVSWANELKYTEGTFQLTPASIEKTLHEINVHCLQNVLHYPLFDESLFDGLNEDQIVDVLANKLIEERQAFRGAQYFGFKYAQYLDSHTNVITDVLRTAGVDDSIATEISKGRGVFNRALGDGAIVKWYCQNIFGHPVENHERTDNPERNLEETQNSATYNFTPAQIIYYGVPGCGKSHQIQEDLRKKNITEENHQVKRVVFHPDYCNADFVGQILPVTKKDGHIRYLFKAGPFTKILRDAYANPDKEYALIIEEINRGNAAAIFGDLFQLLDRKRESDQPEVVNGNSYGPGWSDYCVENDYINAYFRGAYEGEEIPDPLPPKTLGKITFNDNVDIRLPPNLSLYATMNTSDQNVFTLDNAFQRRWEMKQISNDLKNDDAHPDEKAQYDQFIGNTGVKWGTFREKINEIIMQSAEENGLSSMEDKRLGGWFVIPKKSSEAPEGAKATITSEAFAEKVLKYLWDDAFKFDRKSHFGDVRTLEKLIENFKKVGFNVFVEKSEVIAKLQPNNPTDAPVEGASPAEPTNPNLDAPIAE